VALSNVHHDHAGQQERRQAGPWGGKRRSSNVVAVDDSHVAVSESPARALQAHVSRSLDQVSPPRWSPRATLAFVIVVCGSFWVAVGAVAAVLLR
jgi:hypothetical protein